MKKRGLLVSGITILILLLLWMKFESTETYQLIFHPEEYFASNTSTNTNDFMTENTLLGDLASQISDEPQPGDSYYEVEAVEYQLDALPEEMDGSVALEDIEEPLVQEETSVVDPLVSETDTLLYYAYTNMDISLRPLYEKIYDILSTRSEDIKLPTLDEKEIDVAFTCVIQDHPELFYVDGYVYSIYRYGDVVDSITFSGKYSMTLDEIAQTQAVIDAYVAQFVDSITPSMDTYEKVKAAYECIILNTTYNLYAVDNQNANSVFVYRESVCQGYAEAFQYLLYELGISCMVVTGTADGGPHAFNLVRIDGQYYYVDTTWGEGQVVISGSTQTTEELNYDYLNITTDEIAITHTFDSPVPLPNCTSLDANYYVREGYYLTSLDATTIKSMFDRAYANGVKKMTIKCATTDLYQELKKYLFVEEHIFDFVYPSTTQVSYVNGDLTRTITVYL